MAFKTRYLFFILFIMPYIEFAEAAECGGIPSDGCSITRNTVFEEGRYELPHGIIINANNVFLDCNNSILDGGNNFQNGITIFGSLNVTVKNCNVAHYGRANLFVRESDGARIEDNIFSGSEWNYGVNIYHSSKSELKNNVMENNRIGLYVEGLDKDDYDHDIDSTNKINSREIIYLFDVENEVLRDEKIGRLEINFGENISIINNNINGDGIKLNNVISSFVFLNTIKEADVGLDLQNSDGNKIGQNKISESEIGIRSEESDGNSFESNNISSNNYEGFTFVNSNNNLIENNEITNSKYYNIRLIFSASNLFLKNIINKAGDSGVLIDSSISEGNNFSYNHFEDNLNYNLINLQEAIVFAKNNWWGSNQKETVEKYIYEREDNRKSGRVFFRPFLRERN